MRVILTKLLTLAFLALIAMTGITGLGRAQKSGTPFTRTIPKTWDDEAMAALEVPLANAVESPKHVPADYYYRIPVRAIYKSYPVYAPGHEPPGYMDWLKKQEPVIVWDGAGHAPRLATDADWIGAGELVFDSPLFFDRFATVDDLRDPKWYDRTRTAVARDGTMPFTRYIIRRKGIIEVGGNSCAQCHTRLMPDETVLKGAQGNFQPQHMFAYNLRKNAASTPNREQLLAQIRGFVKSLHGAPFVRPDPEARIDQMSLEEIADVFDAVPPGASLRQGGSTFHPIQVPDLIGVKDRLYLDRTGLQQHRSIVDLMRYAALNQGGDSLASYAGFVPADAPRFRQLPDPSRVSRYSDEQLYALALYVYSLKPPPNPNKFNVLAERGQNIFARESCAMCHTPPLYTNNKLTPAEGFTIPEDHLKKYDILPISVRTDANLTLRTRRGTGYYKVPSLKGVWYRSMFGHSGWCANLEDWFDPRGTRDDYVPTGFKPYGVKTYAVNGHPFGLNLSKEDRKALIAFLRTL